MEIDLADGERWMEVEKKLVGTKAGTTPLSRYVPYIHKYDTSIKKPVSSA